MSTRSVAPHGTRARYGDALERCRCAACVKANRDYQRLYRANGAGVDQAATVTVCPTCRRLHTITVYEDDD